MFVPLFMLFCESKLKESFNELMNKNSIQPNLLAGETVSCICKNNKCPTKYNCTPIKSFKDAKGIVYIFVKGTYEVNPAKHHTSSFIFKAPSTIYVNGTQTIAILKSELNDEKFVSFGLYEKYASECSEVHPAISGHQVAIAFSEGDSYDLDVDLEGDLSLLLKTDTKEVDLSKTHILLNFVKKGSVTGMYCDLTDEQTCKSINLKEYTSSPTIRYKGKLSNAKDLGKFIKKRGLSTGAIVGIVIGCVVFVGGVVAAAIIIYKLKQGPKRETSKI